MGSTMKLLYRICFTIFIVSIISLLFSACESEESKMPITKAFFPEFVSNDATGLTDTLTKAYDIEELNNFFGDYSENEHIGFQNNNNLSTLTINMVNQRFPIEILRSNGYSVYKVKSGGYFYVFWINPFNSNSESTQSIDEPIVYFTAYLPSSKEASAFDSLKTGVSTADDVALIDPSFELTFLMSSGIYSYSFLNKDSVMQIEYTYSGEFKSRSDLIVKNKTVLAREIAPSRFASILLKDLP